MLSMAALFNQLDDRDRLRRKDEVQEAAASSVLKNMNAIGTPEFQKVRGINAPGAASVYSRKLIDELTEFVKQFEAKGLAWFRVEPDGKLWSGTRPGLFCWIRPKVRLAKSPEVGSNSPAGLTEKKSVGCEWVPQHGHW